MLSIIYLYSSIDSKYLAKFVECPVRYSLKVTGIEQFVSANKYDVYCCK